MLASISGDYLNNQETESTILTILCSKLDSESLMVQTPLPWKITINFRSDCNVEGNLLVPLKKSVVCFLTGYLRVSWHLVRGLANPQKETIMIGQQNQCVKSSYPLTMPWEKIMLSKMIQNFHKMDLNFSMFRQFFKVFHLVLIDVNNIWKRN